MAIVPIYPHTFDYANERGESAAWRESVEASSACVKDIDKAVHDSYLGEYRSRISLSIAHMTAGIPIITRIGRASSALLPTGTSTVILIPLYWTAL